MMLFGRDHVGIEMSNVCSRKKLKNKSVVKAEEEGVKTVAKQWTSREVDQYEGQRH